ncbi:MAG: hydrolase [Phycisphaerales bacterium]|nr:hydrolase [Phycisphaerales bacterium]
MSTKIAPSLILVALGAAAGLFLASGGSTAEAHAEVSRAAALEQGGDTGWHRTLLTPKNAALVLIDFQPQMAFGVQSHDRQTIKNNAVALAKAAKVFGVPTILTTVETDSFSGPMWPEILAVFPGQKTIERSSMNTWDSQEVKNELKAAGRPKLILAGLWTEVCISMPSLEALREGYEVYVVTDACGGTSKEAHDMAIQRVVQAGAVPVTWQQVMLEWQRDWHNKETYGPVTGVIREHSGAYGMGINYVIDMVAPKKK